MHFTKSEKAIMRISVDLITANSQLIYLKKIVGDIEAIDYYLQIISTALCKRVAAKRLKGTLQLPSRYPRCFVTLRKKYFL